MNNSPLNKLEAFGQSIWLDYIKRDLISEGQLTQLIEEDSLRGITSNPSIFEKSISEGTDYDADIKKYSDAEKNINEIYELITQKDVADAADVFRPLYQELNGSDGYVSLEVNPHLARDTQGTIDEARRLWKALERPNVFIKVPATKEGLPAIKQLISDGININVTLLFGLERYREVAQAYIAGIKDRLSRGLPVKHIASVASFFLSRIDAELDPLFDKIIEQNSNISNTAKQVQGQIAIASAKRAYQIYQELFNGAEFKALKNQGAQVQRLLWASTSTKNPAYSDIKYVEALIGEHTVNTLPLETIQAYKDHGDPKSRLTMDVETMNAYFSLLPQLGVDIEAVTQKLENEGIDKFIKSFDQLIKKIKDKM